MRMSTLRVLVLGDHKVGKSAVTVRFLTKRFIGEYYSDTDHVYRHSVRQEDSSTDLEVCDTCSRPCGSNMEEGKFLQADAFVIIYSICSRRSFITAKNLLHTITKLRPANTSSSSSSSTPASTALRTPTLLLGNMTDLEHLREVGVEEGHELSLSHGCQFYEVSAADSALSVDVAFTAFLREARTVVQHRAVLKRRRSSLGRRIGGLFSKASLGGGGSSSNKGSGSGGGKGQLARSSSVSDGLKLSSPSGSGSKPSLRRCSSITDSTNPISFTLTNGKDREGFPSNGNGSDVADRKMVLPLNSNINNNRDNNNSPSSPSSPTRGSDVFIADALLRRASLVNNNSNFSRRSNNEDGDRRKNSLPTLPEVRGEGEKKRLQNLLNGNSGVRTNCVDSDRARDRLPSGEADRR